MASCQLIPVQGKINNNLPWEGIILSQQPVPDWMKSALDERFNELARISSKLDEAALLHDKQVEIEQQLRQELTPIQFQFILKWEETMNYRNAIEKEWMYRAGLKDACRWRESFIGIDAANK